MCAASVCLFGLKAERLLCRQDTQNVVCVSLGAAFFFFFFFCLLVCMCAAVTQPLRPDPLVKSQKIALCYKVALLHGQPLIIVCILLQMLHAKKPQHKHTLGTDYDASLTRHGAKIHPLLRGSQWIM